MEVKLRLIAAWGLLNPKQREMFWLTILNMPQRSRYKEIITQLNRGEANFSHYMATMFLKRLEDHITSNSSMSVSEHQQGKREWLSMFNRFIILALQWSNTELSRHNIREFTKEAERLGHYDLLYIVLTWQMDRECLTKPSKYAGFAERAERIELMRDLPDRLTTAKDKRDLQHMAYHLHIEYFSLVDQKGSRLRDDIRALEIVTQVDLICSHHKVGKAEYFRGLIKMDWHSRQDDYPNVEKAFLRTILAIDEHDDLHSDHWAFRVYSDFMDACLIMGYLEDVENISDRNFQGNSDFNYLVSITVRITAKIHLSEFNEALELIRSIDDKHFTDHPFDRKRISYFEAVCYFRLDDIGACKRALRSFNINDFDPPGFNFGVRYLECLIEILDGNFSGLFRVVSAMHQHRLICKKNKYQVRQRDNELYRMFLKYCQSEGRVLRRLIAEFRHKTHELFDVWLYLNDKMQEAKENNLAVK